MATDYPTKYASLDSPSLHCLFASDNWRNHMSYQDRLQACQEVENRLAQERGTLARAVIPKQMDGKTYGYQSGAYLVMNEHMLRDNAFPVSYKDENGTDVTHKVEIDAVSWQTLDTVYHEDWHGVQEDTNSPTLMREYIDPTFSGDYDLYRIQGCEKEAFAAGNDRTLEALRTVQAQTGQCDPEQAAYLAAIRAESFDEALERAAAKYDDADIEQALAQVGEDRYSGVLTPDPSEAYQRIDSVYDLQSHRQLQALINGTAREEAVSEEITPLENQVPDHTEDLDDGAELFEKDGMDMDDSLGLSVYTGENLDDGAELTETDSGYDGASYQEESDGVELTESSENDGPSTDPGYGSSDGAYGVSNGGYSPSARAGMMAELPPNDTGQEV